MISINDNRGVTQIKIDGSQYEFKNDINELLNDNQFIAEISMKDLYELFNLFGGIPYNFKSYLHRKNELYGQSKEVSSFYYEGSPVWLHKEERSDILNMLTYGAKEVLEADAFALILNNEIVWFDSNDLIELLSKLSIYSYKSKLNTLNHTQDIDKLETLKEIIEYDYTTGYPDKIRVKNGKVDN